MTIQTLSKLIRPALAHPDFLKITDEAAGGFIVFRVSVHGADYGRLCGKEGRNLKSLNAIVEPIAPGSRVVLNAALTRDRFEHVQPDPNWNPEPVLEMLRAWNEAAGVGGSVEISEQPRETFFYDVFFTEQPPPEIINAVAKWASIVAQSLGGKISIHGAERAAAVAA
jgi:predicted RNA-binding protein YlqC (UPF0109 family)